jgi:pimeloyl-ACP methyl ester carboxylesterase
MGNRRRVRMATMAGRLHARPSDATVPALLAALDVPAHPWLFGHSDGGSIALLYAAAFADAPAGVVALARISSSRT